MASSEIMRTIRANRSRGTVVALAFMRAAGVEPLPGAPGRVKAERYRPSRREVRELLAHPTQVDMRGDWR